MSVMERFPLDRWRARRVAPARAGTLAFRIAQPQADPFLIWRYNPGKRHSGSGGGRSGTPCPMTSAPDDIPFDRTLAAKPEELQQVSPLVRRLVANNGGPFTFTGTCTYVVGRG